MVGRLCPKVAFITVPLEQRHLTKTVYGVAARISSVLIPPDQGSQSFGMGVAVRTSSV
jgi:hypothetical protein